MLRCPLHHRLRMDHEGCSLQVLVLDWSQVPDTPDTIVSNAGFVFLDSHPPASPPVLPGRANMTNKDVAQAVFGETLNPGPPLVSWLNKLTYYHGAFPYSQACLASWFLNEPEPAGLQDQAALDIPHARPLTARHPGISICERLTAHGQNSVHQASQTSS